MSGPRAKKKRRASARLFRLASVWFYRSFGDTIDLLFAWQRLIAFSMRA